MKHLACDKPEPTTPAEPAPTVEQKVCGWRQDEDHDSDAWHTGCNNMFTLNEGGPIENDLKFCCYCGGTLTETHWPTPEEDDADASNTTQPS